MNAFLCHVIDGLTTNLNGIKAMVLRGSQQTDGQVDLWSDTDLLVILHPGIRVDEPQFVQAVDQIGFVMGSELYRGRESMLYRTAIEFQSSIQLLDATICSYNEWILTEASKDQLSTIVYGQIEISEKTKTTVGDYSFVSYESQINETWFKYFMAVKKFARNDNLIGMHLLLDLIREYLVIEMIERDIRHQTNIHRFGYAEQLPVPIKLCHIDESDKGKICDYIAGLAYEYDKKLTNNIKNYRSRYQPVAEYVERSKQYSCGEWP